MLWKHKHKHKPTNHTQTHSERQVWLSDCARKREMDDILSNIWFRCSTGKDPPKLLDLTQRLSTAGSQLILLSLRWISCLLFTREKERDVSFRPTWRNDFLSACQHELVQLYRACLSTSVDLLGFWLCRELFPRLPRSLPLTAQIVPFQVNLQSVQHFLWYVTFLSNV